MREDEGFSTEPVSPRGVRLSPCPFPPYKKAKPTLDNFPSLQIGLISLYLVARFMLLVDRSASHEKSCIII